MMVWLTSKVFQNVFLKEEKDSDILKAQYVIVSTRIRKREEQDNIISAQSILYPNASVCSALTDDDLRERYLNQLMGCKPFLATLIKGSIEEKYNIVFICTHKERKLKYLQYLSEFIYIEFGFPLYEYKSYADGSIRLIKYNKDKVLKKCNKILEKAKNDHYMKEIKTKEGRKRVVKDFKKMKKSELIDILEKKNLYIDGMSKSEMVEMIELFL